MTSLIIDQYQSYQSSQGSLKNLIPTNCTIKSGQFSNDQAGFLRLGSTITCLLKNTDNWYYGLDLRSLMGLVFIELIKAFDTVDHDILLEKLAYCGVQSRALSWFQSNLSNCKRFCRVNSVDSDTCDIKVGVPQGSCLDPLLF